MAICWQWFCYTWTCITFLMLWVVELIYGCGRKKEHFMWSVPLPNPSDLYFPPFICMVGACLQGSIGAHGWVVRFYQPSVQSSTWSWPRKVKALSVNLEMSSWCYSLWISLYSLKARVWPLLWWGFSFRTSFLFYIVVKSNSLILISP